MVRFQILVLAIAVFLIPALAQSEQCNGPEDATVTSALNDHSFSEYHHIVDWALAEDVVARCPSSRLELQVEYGKKLYVWMRSAGNRKALERLISRKKLPLQHIWKQKVGGNWLYGEKIVVSGTTIHDEDIQGLMTEMQNRGFFDWRTSSSKKNLRPGWWKVSITDRYGDNVDCNGDDSPCEIEFEVK